MDNENIKKFAILNMLNHDYNEKTNLSFRIFVKSSEKLHFVAILLIFAYHSGIVSSVCRRVRKFFLVFSPHVGLSLVLILGHLA